MSQTEEQQEPTPEQEATPSTTEQATDEVHIVDVMKPPSAPSAKKPLKRGTRKSKAGASAPAVTNLSSISTFEEEEIEMDDLPIRANAPEHLIDERPNPSERRERRDDDDRPRRGNRSRGERRGGDRPRRAPDSEEETTNQAEENEAQAEERPERFGMVSQSNAPESEKVEEFRPSRDGRTAPKRERSERPRSSTPKPQPKKKGILSKILSFFSGGDSEEEKKEQRKGRSDNRQRGGRRRGPNNRQNREGEENREGGQRRRKRRPRNRGPRQDGEGRERNPDRQNREGGERRRRRRPRRQDGERRRDTERSSAE